MDLLEFTLKFTTEITKVVNFEIFWGDFFFNWVLIAEHI